MCSTFKQYDYQQVKLGVVTESSLPLNLLLKTLTTPLEVDSKGLSLICRPLYWSSKSVQTSVI